jgi:23S rRNA (cytosine1962-C5)-methyltransferase
LDFQVLRLKPGSDRRLRGGHLWVYSNEVDTGHSPLKQFSAGEVVLLEDSRGKPLATAYVNPNTLICARILNRNYRQALGPRFIRQRLASALALRETLFAEPFYRLVYGDSDGLPGLVVDRYDDVLVAQFNTAGMQAMGDQVLEVLADMFQPRAIVLRNDSAAREPEGLSSHVELVSGSLDEPVLLRENDTDFEVPVLEGQKTGWFYDHRLNRLALQKLVAGRRVLDVFSYIGGWGVQAARAGATEVLMVDSSSSALALALQNAERNGREACCAVREGNAQQVMKELYQEGRRFDAVVLDPPAFIKRRKDARQGLAGYRRINELAMRLVEPGGFLVSASCSMHLPPEGLVDTVRGSARQLQRDVRIFGQGHQAPDHPVHPAITETAYLKALFCQVFTH